MIIAVDGYEANAQNRVGVSQYAYEILRHLYLETQSSYPRDNHQFRIYIPEAPRSDMPKEAPFWRYIVGGPKRLWTVFRLPYRLIIDKPVANVVFSPTHYIPRFTHIPRVMSIMDMSFLQYPDLFLRKDLYKLSRWTEYAARHAKKILTISEFSKNAIIQSYRLPEDDIVVTHPGLRTQKEYRMTKEEVTKKYSIPPHYILSVGTIQPRKNYVKLIEAFKMFLALNKQKFQNITLVIVGKKGWLYEEILKAPASFGVENQVKFLDFVTDDDLPSLYAHALCFALPSLYEGFGLPVLEAMSYRCPVVVSNISSLPEIAGKAGVYVDPKNSESIAQGLLTAVRQRNLLQGKRRVQLGIEQTKKFTWEAAAKKTLRVLEEVGGKAL